MMKKKNKRLAADQQNSRRLLLNGSSTVMMPTTTIVSFLWRHNIDDRADDEKMDADRDEYWSAAFEEIKWDSMFQNLKPTWLNLVLISFFFYFDYANQFEWCRGGVGTIAIFNFIFVVCSSW